MKLYHATFKAYLDSIQEKGLIPGFNHNWSMSKNDCIYLSESWAGAGDFCQACWEVNENIYESGILVFEIDTKNLNMDLLSTDMNWATGQEFECYEYRNIIPYKFLMPYMDIDTE